MTNELKEAIKDLIDDYAHAYCGSDRYVSKEEQDQNDMTMNLAMQKLSTLINQKEKESEVRALFKLSKHYDSLEQSHAKDFEGNEIATWSGYKHFRNPITDRIEELIGVRDDKSIYEWLDRIKQLKEELKEEVL